MKVAQYVKYSWLKINFQIKNARNSSTVMKLTCVLSASMFLLLQMSVLTFLCCFTMIFCIWRLININFNKMRQRGIIGYLPRTLQIHLLDRSIFDLLCDFWYIPKASQYLKAFIKPFVENISPEQAATALQDLPENTKKAIMTKGLINIFPNFVQSAIMPYHLENNQSQMPFIKQRDDDTEDQDSLGSTNTTKSTQLHQFEETELRTPPFYIQELEYPMIKSKQQTPQMREILTQQSPIKEITIRSSSPPIKKLTKNNKHEFSFNNNLFKLSTSEPNTFVEAETPSKKLPQLFPYASSSDNDQDDDQIHSSTTNFYDIFHNRTNSGSAEEELPKTKLIASSSSQIQSSTEDINQLEGQQSGSQKPKITDKWDKLEMFRNKLKSNYLRFLNGNHGNANNMSQINNSENQSGSTKPNILNSARQIINMFHNIMELKKKGNLQNIDNKKLIKLFLMSSAFMAAQVSTSKRARRWMINTSLMFLYVLSFLLTTGTLGILAYKYHSSQPAPNAIKDISENTQNKKKQKQRETVSD